MLTKAFLFAIVGIPVMMIGVIVVAVVLIESHEEPPLVGTVVADCSRWQCPRVGFPTFSGNLTRSENTRAALYAVRDSMRAGVRAVWRLP